MINQTPSADIYKSLSIEAMKYLLHTTLQFREVTNHGSGKLRTSLNVPEFDHTNKLKITDTVVQEELEKMKELNAEKAAAYSAKALQEAEEAWREAEEAAAYSAKALQEAEEARREAEEAAAYAAKALQEAEEARREAEEAERDAEEAEAEAAAHEAFAKAARAKVLRKGRTKLKLYRGRYRAVAKRSRFM